MSGYGDNRLLKKAYATIPYTPEQIEELTHCMDPDTGPFYFIDNFIKVQHPVKGEIPLKMYDYQLELVKCYHEYRKSINLLGRQLGKTTVAGAYLLWYAMFNPNVTVLIASNKHSGALEIMSRVSFAYESIPDHIRAGVLTYNKGAIEFDNKSRIIATTTTMNTGRGMSLSLVYLDEFAFVEQNIQREFWTSISPTLSTGGRIIITSTPNVDSGDVFSELWFGALHTYDEYGNETEVGQNGFKPFFADWTAHPDRDENWAAEQRAELGEERFLREHCCKFIAFEETLISPIKLESLKGVDPTAKIGEIRWYTDNINNRKTYVVGLDPSMGVGRDAAAIVAYELPSMKQVAEWRHNKTDVEGQIRNLRQICKDIESHGVTELYWSVENNSLGEAALAVIRNVGEENIPGTMLHDPYIHNRGTRRKGFSTTTKTKMEACARLKNMVETDRISIKSKVMVDELKSFIAKGNTFTAKEGSTDDVIMATLLIIRMAELISSWDTEVWEKINRNPINDELDDDVEQPMPIVII